MRFVNLSLLAISLLFISTFTSCFSNSGSKNFGETSSFAYRPGIGLSNSEISYLPLQFGSRFKSIEDQISTRSMLSDELLNALQLYTDNTWDPIELADDSTGAQILSQEQLFSRAADLANEHDINFILFGVLEEGKDKIGGSFGAEASAKLQYRLWLYSTREQGVIWTTAFKSIQVPLAENLLSIGGDTLSFKTLKQLAKGAFKLSAEMLNTYSVGENNNK